MNRSERLKVIQATPYVIDQARVLMDTRTQKHETAKIAKCVNAMQAERRKLVSLRVPWPYEMPRGILPKTWTTWTPCYDAIPLMSNVHGNSSTKTPTIYPTGTTSISQTHGRRP